MVRLADVTEPEPLRGLRMLALGLCGVNRPAMIRHSMNAGNSAKDHFLGLAGATATMLGVFLVPWVRWPILAIGAITLVVYAVRLLRIVRKPFLIWQQTGPVGWDMEGFIGGSRIGDHPVQIRMFQAGGVVRKATSIENAYLLSHAGDLKSQALISADKGYLKPRNLGRLGKGTGLRVQASFAGDLTPNAGGDLSIPENEFVKKWPGFAFIVEYQGGVRFVQNFSPQDIKDCLDRSLPRRRKRS